MNLSECGMLVLAKNGPPLGVEVEVDLIMPAFIRVPRPVPLHGVGRVCRIEECDQSDAFALAVRVVNARQAQGQCTPCP